MHLKYIIPTCLITLTSMQSQSQKSSKVGDPKSIFIVGYQKQFSQHYIGWTASFKEIMDTLNVFTIPLVYSVGKSSLKNDTLEKNNLASLDNIATGVGFNGYEQLVNGFFLNLGLGAKVGSENSRNLANEKANHFFISGNTNIGFLWVPSKELGINIGSSLFGSLSNSKYVNTDWGVNVEIGINF